MPTTSRRWTSAALTLPLLAALTACGSTESEDTPGSPSSTTGPGSTSGPGSTTGSGSEPAPGTMLFPLTISRRGGIAGVDDRVVVAADGTATLSTRTTDGSCVVPEEGMAALRQASDSLAGASTETLPATPDVADGFVVTISSAAGEASLTDPLLAGSTQVVEQLLRAAEQPPTDGADCS